MKSIIKFGFVALVLLSTLNSQLSTALAQSTAFTYQGRLNNAGVPANGTYDLTFTLFDAASGGAQQGNALTNTAATISNGLFTVTLDFGNQFPGAARWLEIAVRTNGGGAFATLSPRQALTSTPYAIQAGHALNAATAATAGSVAATNITGTLADTQLSADVALRAGGNAFTGNQTFNNGTIAVGTTNPVTWLTVRSPTNDYGIVHTDGTQSLGTFLGYGGGWFGTISDDPLYFYVNNGWIAMAIATNNNVGIGTANPGLNTLQINPNYIPANGYGLLVNNTSFGQDIQINSAAGQGGIALVLDNAANGDASTSMLLVRNNMAGAGRTLLNVQAGGNVGIGTGLPQRLLQVGDQNVLGSQGMIRLGSRTTTGGGAARTWDLGVPQTGDNTTGVGYSFIIQDTGAADPAFISRWDTGNVGIHTTNPAVTLDVNGTLRATALIGSGAGLTNVPGALTPQLLAGTAVSAQPNQSYDATSASQTTVTLPASANVGDVVQVNGVGAGGWQVQAGGGQTINGGYPAGVIWSPEGPTLNWNSVACSADASRAVASVDFGGVYTSIDGGVTWVARLSAGPWKAVASSANGLRMVAVASSGPPSFSTDGGASWFTTVYFGGGQTSVASSADGLKLAIVTVNGPIWLSTNGGTNWTAHGPTNNYAAVTSSADGSKLAAAVNGGQIYTSTDGGTTWNPGGPSASWKALASSTDGNSLVAVINGGQIYTSANGGGTWTARDSSRAWWSVASSADGSQLVATAFPGQIYVSRDSGATWSPEDSSRYWAGVASSALGNKLVAVVGARPFIPGQVYVSSTQPSGAQGTSISLQYLGNGVWQPIASGSPADLPNTVVTRDSTGAFSAGTITAGALIANSGPNLFNGNVGIDNAAPNQLLVVGGTPSPAYCDGTTWVNGSDRNYKENFAAVNASEVLARVIALPMESWSYKARPGNKHIGPMAQDFHAAFGLNGSDDTHIATVDESGVALAAIQGLNEKVESGKQKTEIQVRELALKLEQKENEVADLKQQLADLKQLVNALSEKATGGAK